MNKHVGSSLDDFLEEEGILEETKLEAEKIISKTKKFRDYLATRLDYSEILELEKQVDLEIQDNQLCLSFTPA
jgi:hypothetical protein